MFCVELLALVGTCFAEIGAGRRHVGAVVRVPGHHAGVQRRMVSNIAAQLDTASHLLVTHTDAFGGAPLAGLGGLKAVVDTLYHPFVFAGVANLLKSHRVFLWEVHLCYLVPSREWITSEVSK